MLLSLQNYKVKKTRLNTTWRSLKFDDDFRQKPTTLCWMTIKCGTIVLSTLDSHGLLERFLSFLLKR